MSFHYDNEKNPNHLANYMCIHLFHEISTCNSTPLKCSWKIQNRRANILINEISIIHFCITRYMEIWSYIIYPKQVYFWRETSSHTWDNPVNIHFIIYSMVGSIRLTCNFLLSLTFLWVLSLADKICIKTTLMSLTHVTR